MTKRQESGLSPDVTTGPDAMPPTKDPRRVAPLVNYIDRRKREMGIDSDVEVSRRGGGRNRDDIRDIRRGSIPGSAKLAVIARGLGVSPTILHNLLAGLGDSAALGDSRIINAPITHETFDTKSSRPIDERDQDLPLMRQGPPQAKDAYVSSIGRPIQLIGRSDAYAFYIADDRNAPMVREGHIAYIDPSRPTVLDSWVRVFPTDGVGFIGILIDRTPETVSIRVLSEPEPITLRRSDILKKERVVGFMLLDA